MEVEEGGRAWRCAQGSWRGQEGLIGEQAGDNWRREQAYYGELGCFVLVLHRGEAGEEEVRVNFECRALSHSQWDLEGG